MLNLGGNHRVFLCVQGVDFRKAHDGLCALVRDEFKDDPFTGDVFAFHNGARDRIKLLGNGVAPPVMTAVIQQTLVSTFARGREGQHIASAG